MLVAVKAAPPPHAVTQEISGQNGNGDGRLSDWAVNFQLELPSDIMDPLGSSALAGAEGMPSSKPKKKKDKKKDRREGWPGEASSSLLAAGAPLRVPWVVYPGLFAGGRLDVMTAFLLRQLPPHPPKLT